MRARLRLLEEAVEDLQRQGELDAERLRSDRDTRRVVERCLEHLVDMAASVNAHIAAARLGRAPTDLTESFDLAAEAGAIPQDLAAELRSSAGMRNVIVHAYVDLDLELVARAVPAAIEGYRSYMAEMAAFIRGEEDGWT